ncbi:MAG: hypothetical protein HZB31_09490 [Nitrospirae bacterium]|nr:hypothetical protein [Nitrospirota bacterium]
MAEFKNKAEYERWKKERDMQSELRMKQRGSLAGASAQRTSSGIPIGLIITLVLTVAAIAGVVCKERGYKREGFE